MKNQIAESQKVANGSGSQQDIAEAKIELEVCCYQSSLIYSPTTNTVDRFWRVCRLLSSKLDLCIYRVFT